VRWHLRTRRTCTVLAQDLRSPVLLCCGYLPSRVLVFVCMCVCRPCSVHIVGRDIMWFHCVVWPCMLLSAGIPLPVTVFGHGWVLAGDNEKMSKSVGNVVDPVAILDRFPSDTLRSYLVEETTCVFVCRSASVDCNAPGVGCKAPGVQCTWGARHPGCKAPGVQGTWGKACLHVVCACVCRQKVRREYDVPARELDSAVRVVCFRGWGLLPERSRVLTAFRGCFLGRARTRRHNAQLADTLGNIVHRVCCLLVSLHGGTVPDVPAAEPRPFDLAELAAACDAHVKKFELREFAQKVWDATRAVNVRVLACACVVRGQCVYGASAVLRAVMSSAMITTLACVSRVGCTRWSRGRSRGRTVPPRRVRSCARPQRHCASFSTVVFFPRH
jgi:hypothetical protein